MTDLNETIKRLRELRQKANDYAVANDGSLDREFSFYSSADGRIKEDEDVLVASVHCEPWASYLRELVTNVPALLDELAKRREVTTKAVTISMEQMDAYIQLQRAAEYQAKYNGDNTIQMLTDALEAVRKAGLAHV